jgi:hypothetical protein
MRTFGELMVHIAGAMCTRRRRRWSLLMEKSIGDAEAVLKNVPDSALANNIEPWIGRDGA